MSFVGTTAQGKKIPNPNVLIELGFAARSVGWDRTILILNQAYGPASSLPFDILQHRWPIEYRVTAESQVLERKFDKFSSALESALLDCEQHILTRATEMASGLDMECLGFIARYEGVSLIDIPPPAKTVGEHLSGINLSLIVHHLMQLGALEIVAELSGSTALSSNVGYRWTYDGQRMIEQVNRRHPVLLGALRHLRLGTLPLPNPNKEIEPSATHTGRKPDAGD